MTDGAAIFWKGYLELSLVTCPVAMTPANSEREGSLSHAQSIDQQPHPNADAETGKPIDDEELTQASKRSSMRSTLLTEKRKAWLSQTQCRYLMAQERPDRPARWRVTHF
jgi:non-homologous end joining protein Ku